MVINDNYSLEDVIDMIGENYDFSRSSVKYHLEKYFSYVSLKDGTRKRYSYIYFFGGKCVYCGLNQPHNLVFHHLDKNEKALKTDSTSLTKISHKEGYQEINNKCVLCCANCHREIHMRMRDQSKMMIKSSGGLWIPCKKELNEFNILEPLNPFYNTSK